MLIIKIQCDIGNDYNIFNFILTQCTIWFNYLYENYKLNYNIIRYLYYSHFKI